MKSYKVMVAVVSPTGNLKERIDFNVDARALGPLPRNHDNPLEASDMLAGIEQREERQRIINVISLELAKAILRIVESQDEVLGYTQKPK